MEHTMPRLHQSQTKAKEASWIVCKWCQSMIGPIGNEVLWPQKNLKQDIRKGCSATDQKKGPILCPTAKTKNLCIDRNLESQRVSGFPPTKKGCRIAYRGVTSMKLGPLSCISFCSFLRLCSWWLLINNVVQYSQQTFLFLAFLMHVSSLISYIGAHFKLHSERTNSFFFWLMTV